MTTLLLCAGAALVIGTLAAVFGWGLCRAGAMADRSRMESES